MEVYLTPDSEGIDIPDMVETYDGNSYANYTGTNPINVPSSVGTTEIKYVYYDSNGNPLAASEVKNAGAYGVRAYITVTVNDGGTSKKYVIWQSEGETPPLHLYIQRRVVILYSAFAEKTYSASDPSPLVADWVYFRQAGTVYCSSAAHQGDANQAKSEIAKFYTTDTSSPYYLGLVDYSESNHGNAGFVKDEFNHFTWEFAASAFRREQGTSVNLFTYSVPDSIGSNYYFKVCFGTLTVN